MSTPPSAPSGRLDSTARCAGCGLAIPGGTEACEALFHALTAREYAELGLRRHWTLVDIYALQHPDRYCASAKSFAAHFLGLARTIETGRHPSELDRLRRRKRLPVPEKPALPAFRGEVTIADVLEARDAEDFAARVDHWARVTWAAYVELHPLARRALAEILTDR